MVHCFVVQIAPSSLIIKEERNQIFFFFFLYKLKKYRWELGKNVWKPRYLIIIWLFCFLICTYKIMIIFGVYTIKIPTLVDFSSQEDFIKRQSDLSGEKCVSYVDEYFAHLRFIPILPFGIREYLWRIKGNIILEKFLLQKKWSVYLYFIFHGCVVLFLFLA